MASDQSEDDIWSRLIEEIQNYPCIFDKAAPNNFKTDVTNSKFEEIGIILGVLVSNHFNSFYNK